MSLNPRNSNTFAYLGLLLVFNREFEHGVRLVRKAMDLNPHHAGWFHFGLIWDYYNRGEYEKVLEHCKLVNMPGFFWPPLIIASVCGQLGRHSEATAALNDLLAISPHFGDNVRKYIEPWLYASGFLDSLLEGLRLAGLAVPQN